MKNLFLYDKNLTYKVYLLENGLLNNTVCFKSFYMYFFSKVKQVYIIKSLGVQRKKRIFFDKFLLKHLVLREVNSRYSYVQNSTVNKFFRTFVVSGKKLKVYNAVMRSFFKVYSVINLELYKNTAMSYLYFREFLFNKELNRELNSMVSIINWLFFWYQPIFCVKCSLVPKKYRKKLKKKYVYAVSYIDVNKRKNISLRWMLHFLDYFTSYSLNNRLFLLLSDLIFNFKKSLIYDRKVKMYKKMFKI